MRRYRHFVFDLYGTLVDIHTEEDDPRLWEQLSRYFALNGAACDPEALRAEYLSQCDKAQRRADATLRKRGLPGPGEPDVRRVWKNLLKAHGLPSGRKETEAFCRWFRALSLRRLRLFAGAAEVLEALRKAGRGVWLLTNAQAAFTLPELRALGLDTAFDGMLLSSEAGVRKPSPAFFGLLEKRFSVDPREALMIGNDEECDCRGAAQAGMDSLYIQTEQSPSPAGRLPENCRKIERLEEVLLFLD